MKLGIIGGGAMAEAIVSGLLASKILEPKDIIVSDPQPERCSVLRERYGVNTTGNNLAVCAAELLLLAIKPQMFGTVVAQIAEHVSSQLVISILAGISLSTLIESFPQCAHVRAMPNTPALVRAGITALSRSPNTSETLFTRAKDLFAAVGTVVEVPESSMNAVTGLSGSGPGYLAVIIEGLIDGGVAVGLPRNIATQLVLQTVRGSAELLIQENLHPAVLKDRVTSPGGTTIAGIAQLEACGVRSACIAAVQTATDRAKVLGENKT
jgi:pyrroline-5-carboxylate reductase